MGLLNDVKKAEATAPAAGASVTDKSEKKAKAKERKAAKREALKTIIEYLQKNPIKELESAVKTIGTPAERTGGFTAEMLFGDKTRINAVEVFTKFKKGYPEMKKYMKKWDEKGVKVSLDAKTQDYVWEK